MKSWRGSMAKSPEQYNLGQLVRVLEGTRQLVNCADPPCALRFGCGLKTILNEALQAFYQYLDQYTLADIIQGKTQEILLELQRINVVQLATEV